MSEPTPRQIATNKFYELSVFMGDEVVRVILWNGVHEYSYIPPDEVVARAVSLSTTKGNTIIAQVGKNTELDVLEIVKGKPKGLILWTMNTKIYRQAKKIFAENATVRRQ